MNIRNISVMLTLVCGVSAIGFLGADADNTENNFSSHSFYYWVPKIECVPSAGSNTCPPGTFAKIVAMERKEVTYCTPLSNGGTDCRT